MIPPTARLLRGWLALPPRLCRRYLARARERGQCWACGARHVSDAGSCAEHWRPGALPTWKMWVHLDRVRKAART